MYSRNILKCTSPHIYVCWYRVTGVTNGNISSKENLWHRDKISNIVGCQRCFQYITDTQPITRFLYQWIHLYKCMLNHYSMVTPYQLDYIPWWSHQMETFSALLAICAGNSPVIGELPAQRPVTQSFDVFFDLRLNARLSKQWWGLWSETPSCPLWRYCNNPCVLDLFYYILFVWAPFHQSLVRERQLIFHLSGINRLITISSWVQLAFWSVVSIIYIYIYTIMI